MSIFNEQISRKPDYYPWTQEFIKTAHDGFWTHREFTFQSDIQDFKVKLTDQEREIITKSLSTIGQLEISVKKFWSKLGDNLPHPTLYDLGFTFSSQEVIHGDAYERLLEVLGLETAFDDILKMQIISGRVNYLKKYLHKFHADNKRQFVYSIILFTLFIENIALFSQFYVLNWFGRYKNVLKDTNKQTDYSAKEEFLHFQAGVKIINTIREEHPELFDEELESRILEESKKAIEYECKIVEWIVGDYNEDGLNAQLLENFIKNRLNESLVSIGFPKIVEVDEELVQKAFWFDEQLLANSMQDFFYSRPINYAKKSKSFDEDSLFGE
jgi:ribonucleoside-diphosphate reductase beta chain